MSAGPCSDFEEFEKAAEVVVPDSAVRAFACVDVGSRLAVEPEAAYSVVRVGLEAVMGVAVVAQAEQAVVAVEESKHIQPSEVVEAAGSAHALPLRLLPSS